jgi:serine/threonine-protein kinase
MNSEQWQRVSAAFDELCDLPPAERETRLVALARDAADLEAQLRAMLSADADERGALAGGPLALEDLDGLVSDQPEGSVGASLAVGRRVGPWRLLAPLGEGGMGEVWVAERADDTVEQRVAIKLLRRGLETDTLLRRFLRERQILARLTHPGIARLLDAGSTTDGRPFFVMELVDGRTITSWASERELGLEARLQLVIAVCNIVDFAHRNLVVHRDLKPSNMLVTRGGEVKLLDFGIAKLLEPQAGTQMTELEARALTPAYAAPEQIRGEPATTGNDVYALGVLLYELLTAKLPHRRAARGLSDLGAELEQESVERPSSVARAAASPFARRLAGDLDTIVLSALRKEPERRYAKVEQLADDLQRYLTGQPVSARADTFAYRTQKFLGRHRWAVVTAGLVAVTVALLVGFYTARLAAERDRARLEAEKARRVSAFLTSLFELSDVERTKGVKLSVRDIVDRGAARLKRDLASEPELAASMLSLIGNLYNHLDMQQQAVPLLEEALATRRRLVGPLHPEVAASERELGIVLKELGHGDRAAALLRHALSIEEREPGRELEVAKTVAILAAVDGEAGDYRAALAGLERAAALQARAGAAGETDLAQTLTDEGHLYLSLDDSSRALPLLQQAFAIRVRRLGPESPTTVASLLDVGAAQLETGNLDAALAAAQRVLVLAERAYGADHSLYAWGLGELGSVWRAKGQPAKARELYERAIRAFTAIYGAGSVPALIFRQSLAGLLAETGDLRGSLREHQAVLASYQRTLGEDHPRVGQALFEVAEARLALGRSQGAASEAAAARDAEPDMRRGLAIFRRQLRPDSNRLGEGLVALGDLLCRSGDAVEGTSLLREGVTVLAPGHPGGDARLSAARAALRACPDAAGVSLVRR